MGAVNLFLQPNNEEEQINQNVGSGATEKSTGQQVPSRIWHCGGDTRLLFSTCHFLGDHLAALQSIYPG